MSLVNTAVTAVVGALQAGPAVCPLVERVRLRPQAAATASAVVVRPRQAEVQDVEMPTGYPYVWNVVLDVECYARATTGTAPDVAVDALSAAVYARLMADPTLGNAVLLLQPQGVAYDFDADGQQAACATFTFIARMRAAPGSF